MYAGRVVCGAARRLCSAALLLFGTAAVAGTQEVGTGSGTLRGLILRSDTSQATVAGAEVVLDGTTVRASTTARGAYRLQVPAGAHTVLVRAIGYQPTTAQITIAAGDTLERDFLLVPQSDIALDTVHAVASRPRTEFEARMRSRKGQFITREELERQRNRRMADVLSRLTGLRLHRAPGGAAYAMSTRGRVTVRSSNPRCYVHVYLDDAPMYSGDIGASRNPDAGIYDVNQLYPGDLEAVEYYSGLGQIPAKYNRTGAVCGVLLLWTRRPT